MKIPFWKTREFLTICLDLFVSGALYFGGKYLAPSVFDDLKYAIAALQPVAAFLIAYFAVERVQVYVRAQITELRAQLRR